MHHRRRAGRAKYCASIPRYFDTSVCRRKRRLERHENVEALNEFENVGLFRTPPDLARRRGLGGTSSVWTGRCGVFDTIDYQSRPWLPFSGWPIQYDEISPFFDRAGRLLGLGPAIYDYRARDILSQHAVDAPWDSQRLLPVVWQFSRGDGEQVAPPSTPEEANGASHLRALHHAGAPRAVNLGQAALPILSSSKNIDVFLHANATSIETNEEGSKVRAVSIATLEGRRAASGQPASCLRAEGSIMPDCF